MEIKTNKHYFVQEKNGIAIDTGYCETREELETMEGCRAVSIEESLAFAGEIVEREYQKGLNKL